jgi:hypothetical protein
MQVMLISTAEIEETIKRRPSTLIARHLKVGDMGTVLTEEGSDGMLEVQFAGCAVFMRASMLERILTGIEKEAIGE